MNNIVWACFYLFFLFFTFFAHSEELIMDDLIESWAKKNVPFLGQFEKILLEGKDIDTQWNDGNTFIEYIRSHSSREKIDINKLHLLLNHAVISVEGIEYEDSLNVELHNIDPTENIKNVNLYNNDMYYDVRPSVLKDTFIWHMPISRKRLSFKIVPPKIFSTNGDVEVINNSNGHFFRGELEKNYINRLPLIKIPPQMAVVVGEYWKRVKIEQSFKIDLTLDMNIAVVYKTVLGKRKIKIYPLSLVVPEFKRSENFFLKDFKVHLRHFGVFEGDFITGYRQDVSLVVPNSGVVWTKGYTWTRYLEGDGKSFTARMDVPPEMTDFHK